MVKIGNQLVLSQHELNRTDQCGQCANSLNRCSN